MSQIANLFGGGGSIVPGTTPISPSTNRAVLFDDAGFIGENSGFTFNKATNVLAVPRLALNAGTKTANAITFGGTSGINGRAGTIIELTNGTNVYFSFQTSVAVFSSATALAWSSDFPDLNAGDLFLNRDGPNVLGQRNGTSAQKLRAYNTFTSSTNFETFVADWATSANVCLLGTSKGSGGGSARALSLIAGDVVGLSLDTAANVVVASGKNFTLGNAATTGLAAGVLAALTNATIVILDSTGQAYRVPCII